MLCGSVNVLNPYVDCAIIVRSMVLAGVSVRESN